MNIVEICNKKRRDFKSRLFFISLHMSYFYTGKDIKSKSSRVWSIEEMHDLYLRAKARYNSRRKDSKDIVEQIKQKIKPNKSETYIVYFNQEIRGEKILRQYEISFKYGDGIYGTSIGDTRFKTRDEKLEFILANEKAFELGQKFHEAKIIEDGAYRRSSTVESHLWYRIEKELRKIKFPIFSKKIIVIDIGGKKYFISVESHQHYANFTWLNEYDESVMKIS